jgi:D-3-phosphoglycerate dehydrogenase
MTAIFLTHDPAALGNYYGETALAALRALAEVRLNPKGRLLTTDELIEAARGAEIIVGDVNTPAEAALFGALRDLVAFHRCAVDRRTIDLDAASRNGVLVTNASPGFVNSVTELIFGLMIDLARGITDAAVTYRVGAIPPQRIGVQLAGATLGILGYGSIGSFTAEVGRALGMNVLVHDPFKTVPAPGIRQAGMEEILADSDFVVCLVVATEQTRHLMGADAFARMKPGAFFVNVSRPLLVDEDALEAALVEGRIAGAALDVGSDPGMMPPPRLAGLPNVIATPHIGGLTPTATQAQALETVEQARAVLAGLMPHNALNPQHARRLAERSR